MPGNDNGSKRQEDLSAAKQALLQERLRRRHAPTGQVAGIQLRPARLKQAAPLSFAQQRLWFLQQLEPHNPAYNIATAFHLKGLLDVKALRAAARDLTRRHEILRSTFPVTNGQVVQIVHADAITADRVHPGQDELLPVVDLRMLPEEVRFTEAQRYAQKELLRPFRLADEYPWRTMLFQLAEDEYVSLTVMHHILSDAWSTELFLREVGSLYAAFRVGHLSPLPEPRLQYADYAYWQQERLQKKELERELAYWRNQLAGPLPVLTLPADFPRPRTPSYRGQRSPLHISPAIQQKLYQFCHQKHVTPFMFLLAAFQVLLYHYTMQEDLIIGTPIAGRTQPELENMLGCFLNTLVLRTSLSGNPSFSELVQRVRKVTLEAFDHQELPFERIVEELQIEREPSHHPLFQIMFVLQNVPPMAYDLVGMTSQQLTITNQTAKFDLEWCLYESSRGIDGYIEYNSDLFKAETVELLHYYFGRIIEYVLDDPEQLIGHIPLTSYWQWPPDALRMATTEVLSEQPRQCLHVLFERQVQRTPEALALLYEEERLSYTELNQKANQLAHYLLACGVLPDMHIGICLDHSSDLIVAMLAILKSGAAYVPLVPYAGAERLAYIIGDAQISFVVTIAAYCDMLPEQREQMRYILLDDEQAVIHQQMDHNPYVDVTDTYLSYIMYTSGTTGYPKGVLIPHAHVVHLFTATQHLCYFDVSDVWTLFHSYAFDFSVWEIWGALLHGARLIIVPYWVTRSPADFYRLLEREQVTILSQTPSAFYQLIHVEDNPDESRPLALRWIFLSGEALDIQKLLPWFERHGDQHPRLINAYGVTEATVFSTYRLLSREDIEFASSSRIGQALPDQQLYIFNRYLQPVPIGAIGELYIGGARLALGYTHSGLTNERFILHQSGALAGKRFYKTGDLVRCLPDGDLEYIGRNDQQIKLRGYRIEPAEIEAVLCKYPLIRDSAVVVQSSPANIASSEKRLVAYVILAAKHSDLPIKELRGFLRERLPHYMIPGHFVFLDALPLTLNGKLDYQALPLPPALHLPEQRNSELTTTEKHLLFIWCRLLQVEQITIDDNFFELGGHSLLAIQMVSAIRERFGIEIPVHTLFQAPTIASLAEVIEQRLQLDHTTIYDSGKRPSAIPAVLREPYLRKQQPSLEANDEK